MYISIEYLFNTNSIYLVIANFFYFIDVNYTIGEIYDNRNCLLI